MSEPYQFPGFISRQSLVDFCRNRVAELGDLEDTIEEALDTEGLPNEDKCHLLNSLASRFGEQQALRSVCEWAKEHQIPVFLTL